MLRIAVVALASIGLWLAVSSGPATAGGYSHCSGKVKLSHGDYASKIRVKRIGCRKAKRAIKAPATKLGYSCRQVSTGGGNTGTILCRKGHRRIKFAYYQS